MHKQAPNIEWLIAENDADWERQRILPDSEPVVTRHWFLKRYAWGVAGLLLLLVVVGDWWGRTTQGGRIGAVSTLPEWQLAAVAQHDGRAVTQVSTEQQYRLAREYSGLLAATQAAEPNAPLEITLSNIALHNVEFQGDQAVAEVISYASDGGFAQRQTRFYQRTANGSWQMTIPDANLWGPERSLETPSFIFHFRQRDAATVIAVSAQMESFYEAMRHNFALSLAPDAEKLMIDVSVIPSAQDSSRWFRTPYHIRVPSPALYVAPIELTDAELLAQSMALPLLRRVSAQVYEQYQIRLAWPWQPLLNGLRLWQLWEMDLPLAAWREDVVKWLYVEWPAADPNQTYVLPKRYPLLCATHKLWMDVPIQIDIPLLCTEMDRTTWHPFSRYWREPPSSLIQLGVPVPSQVYIDAGEEAHWGNHPAQVVALATLIEYAVVTYGRERLPVLVAGLSQHNTWETLLPAVFGVPPAEFEVGWQTYLATRYAVPQPARHIGFLPKSR